MTVTPMAKPAHSLGGYRKRVTNLVEDRGVDVEPVRSSGSASEVLIDPAPWPSINPRSSHPSTASPTSSLTTPTTSVTGNGPKPPSSQRHRESDPPEPQSLWRSHMSPLMRTVGDAADRGCGSRSLNAPG